RFPVPGSLVRFAGSWVLTVLRFHVRWFSGSGTTENQRTWEQNPGTGNREPGTGNLNPTVALATVGPSIRRVSAVGPGPALLADRKDMKMTPFRSSPAPGVPPGVFGNAAAAAQPVVGAIRFAVAAAAAACATAK